MQRETIECQSCECEWDMHALLRGEATNSKFATDFNFTSPLQSSQTLRTIQTNVVIVVPLLFHNSLQYDIGIYGPHPFFNKLTASPMRNNK